MSDALKEVDTQISAIHAAFGAPGDFGYETREGKALFALYKSQVALRATIRSEPDLLSIAKRWISLDGGTWNVERHAREKAELLKDTAAAIAKASGSEG
jgi:hypothetical protein